MQITDTYRGHMIFYFIFTRGTHYFDVGTTWYFTVNRNRQIPRKINNVSKFRIGLQSTIYRPDETQGVETWMFYNVFNLST